MELRHLRAFAAVGRHHTVHAAAEEMSIAPSSVSERVRRLEADLGVQLFERTRTGMCLTPVGERFLDSVLPALRAIDAGVIVARDSVTSASVRVGALESIAATVLPPLLDAHAVRHPTVAVDLRVDPDRTRLLDALARDEVDAVVLLDIGDSLGDLGFETPTASFEHLDLAEVPLVLVGAPGTQVAEFDLAGSTPVLGNGHRCSFWLASQQWLGQRTIESLGSLSLVKQWAAQGRGVALLPEYAVRTELEDGRLSRIDVEAPTLRLRLVWSAVTETERPGVRSLLYALAG